MSYRLTAIEQRIDRTEEQLQSLPKVSDDAISAAHVSTSQSQELDDDNDAVDDTVIPTTQFLKKSTHIQNAVELVRINEQGTFKSQRGGNEQIQVKCQIPWPQDYVLAGIA